MLFNQFKNREELEIIIYYISKVKNIDENKFKEITKHLLDEDNEEASMVTFLDAIKTKGRIEGKIEEKQKTLIRLLSKKFGITEEEKEIINNCSDGEKLDSALDEILFADSKYKVFHCLD